MNERCLQKYLDLRSISSRSSFAAAWWKPLWMLLSWWHQGHESLVLNLFGCLTCQRWQSLADLTRYIILILFKLKAFSGSQDFGYKTRTANCIEGLNGGQTCFDLLNSTSETKEEKVSCAGDIPVCPINFEYGKWTPWTKCPNCFSPSNPNVQQRRTRSCIDGRYGGSKCPRESEDQKQACIGNL